MKTGRHIIVEGDELYHYGVKGMKWKDHVYATVEKAGNVVKTSTAKVAGAASKFAKKIGKKAKSAGVTAYERLKEKQHKANVKSGYKLKSKTGAERTNNPHDSKARALADSQHNKNINKHANNTDSTRPHSRKKTIGSGKASVTAKPLSKKKINYEAARADEERVRKAENVAYSAQRQKAEKQAARKRVVNTAHKNSPQFSKDRISELNTNKVVNNAMTNGWRNSRQTLDASGLDASQKARIYGFAKNAGREALETQKRKRRK